MKIKKILNASTHFNPVDLVCGIKNYKNEKFDLAQFVDHNSGFIVENNIRKNSKIIRITGLMEWSYGKLDYNICPSSFNHLQSCKSVNDLLKAAHQPK
jgi:hypothetical protein